MGLQPWKIIGGSRLLWYARYEVIRDYEIKAAYKAKNKPRGLDAIEAQRKHK
jgi:hypothetical protein